jgi:triosephosphate isomerase
LVSKLNQAEVPSNVDVFVAPTALHIDLVQRLLTNRSIEISAQNAVQFKSGAYTGEISAEIIADFGVPLVILGHSERRQIFHTDDEVSNDAAAGHAARDMHND